MGRALLYLASLGVLVYSLIDCVQAENARVRNLPKVLWVIVIVFVPLVGPVAWLLGGRPVRDGGTPPPWRRPPSGGPQPRPGGTPPRGPDDDPDFLRQLDIHPHKEPDDPPPGTGRG